MHSGSASVTRFLLRRNMLVHDQGQDDQRRDETDLRL
jgi:hypothetical protein